MTASAWRRQELIDNLGTIARSGTRAFGEALAAAKPEDRPSLIGQFGVGFYSAFMVADRVEVTSRKAGSEEAFAWASDGAGDFTIAPATRETAGTDVVLHIKADAEEYLDPVRLESGGAQMGRPHHPADHHRPGRQGPAGQRGHRAVAQAARRRDRAELQGVLPPPRPLCSTTPWATLHWKAEGTLEFFALLFIPGMKPFEPLDNDRESHVRLHVRRMFITDKAELLPPWLRFVQGVVDTEDLPLNVSREMLQTTPVLGRIRKALIGRVLARAEDARQGSRRLREILGKFRRRAEGGRVGGYRAPHRTRAAAAVQVLDAGGLDLAARIRRRGCRPARTRSGTWPATTPRR